MAKTNNTFKVTTVTLHFKGGKTLTASLNARNVRLTPNVRNELAIGVRAFRGFSKVAQPYSYRGNAYLSAFITVTENGAVLNPTPITHEYGTTYGFTNITYGDTFKVTDNTAVITTTNDEDLAPLPLRYTPIAVTLRYKRGDKAYTLPLFIDTAESYGLLYAVNQSGAGEQYASALGVTAELEGIAETANLLNNN